MFSSLWYWSSLVIRVATVLFRQVVKPKLLCVERISVPSGCRCCFGFWVQNVNVWRTGGCGMQMVCNHLFPFWYINPNHSFFFWVSMRFRKRIVQLVHNRIPRFHKCRQIKAHHEKVWAQTMWIWWSCVSALSEWPPGWTTSPSASKSGTRISRGASLIWIRR